MFDPVFKISQKGGANTGASALLGLNLRKRANDHARLRQFLAQVRNILLHSSEIGYAIVE